MLRSGDYNTPVFVGKSASGLTLLMLGATVTHLRIGEYGYAPFPLVLALLTVTIARMAWPARSPFARIGGMEAQA